MGKTEYSWRWVFLAALKRIDSENYSARLTAADDAVFSRLLELEGTIGTEKERLSLEATMQDLRLLRENSYHFGVENNFRRELNFSVFPSSSFGSKRSPRGGSKRDYR